MDFFERQERARRKTKWLIFCFAMAVIGTVLAVYLACIVFFEFAAFQRQIETASNGTGRLVNVLWNPKIFTYSALGTLAVIATGTVYRFSSLSSGGKSIAQALGGRLVLSKTRDLDERKLLNVVEEMALASGLPVPQVYVLDHEESINAFAAGYTPGDAVIGVTRGCMKLLTRDELQGVIAHEFSHILNGDMRINLRLIGLIFGITCLSVVGRQLMRTRGRKNPLPAFGLALMLIGLVGAFFARLIQAAVSRQREFLADASAVQFTRNPAGLSGALQKIGGLARGSRILNEHSIEASHMFFGNALRSTFLTLFETHPPLEERIRAIDPTWDGKFRPVKPPLSVATSGVAAENAPIRIRSTPTLPRPAQALPVITVATVAGVPVNTLIPRIGNPDVLNLKFAEELRNSIPEKIREAAKDPTDAIALCYALLVSDDPALQSSQLERIKTHAGERVWQKTVSLLPDVRALERRYRLPLVDLALPALRQMTRAEYDSFQAMLQWLVESDEQIDLFEFTLQRIVRRHLEPHFTKTRPPVVQYYAIRPLLPDCAVLMSALAYLGTRQASDAQRVFNAGLPYLRTDVQVALLPENQCSLERVDAALEKLAQAAPLIKKNLIEACIHVVGADGAIHEYEVELLRAIADSIDCPIPPLVAGS